MKKFFHIASPIVVLLLFITAPTGLGAAEEAFERDAPSGGEMEDEAAETENEETGRGLEENSSDNLAEPLPEPPLFIDGRSIVKIVTEIGGVREIEPDESHAPLTYQVMADIRKTPPEYLELAKKLKKIVESPDIYGIFTGVYIQRIRDNKVIFSYNGDMPLNPASNVKLITSAAALSLLGPDYRFKTKIYLDKEPDSNGVVNGNMYIKGSGDPSLVSERLWLLATELKNRGISRIRGHIKIDNSYFSGDKFNPGWRNERNESHAYQSPYDAFSINHNAVAISVLPGNKAGRKPRVLIEPNIKYFKLDNRATVWRKRRTRLKVSTEPDGNKTKIIVKGRIGRRFKGRRLYRMIYHPDIFAGETLKKYLWLKGIKVSGRIKKGIVPENSEEFYTFKSPPLSTILKKVNKYSSNFTAEQLVKTLGANVYEPPGNWINGLKVLKEFMGLVGSGPQEFLLENGSGLSEDNRVSAHSFVRVLSYLYSQDYIKPEYLSSLSIAGADGTLSGRMVSIPKGALRAKTGSLDNVCALSGYTIAPNGEALAFSAILNVTRGKRLDYSLATGVLDEIGEALSLPATGR